jgi:hypothetical protein
VETEQEGYVGRARPIFAGAKGAEILSEIRNVWIVEDSQGGLVQHIYFYEALALSAAKLRNKTHHPALSPHAAVLFERVERSAASQSQYDQGKAGE